MTENENAKDDNPGVVMRPPRLHLLMLVIGLVLGAVEPLPIIGPEWRGLELAGGGVLLLGGIALLFACARRFARAGTNVPTNEPTKALVTTGPYAVSRNPIYLSLLAIYLGFALTSNIAWILLLALPLIVTMEFGVIRREERYLETKFGDDYRSYKSRVRRWI